jgi:hypothetical protein
MDENLTAEGAPPRGRAFYHASSENRDVKPEILVDAREQIAPGRHAIAKAVKGPKG